LARARAGQLQIRNIRASNQQQEADGGEHHTQAQPLIAQERGSERLQAKTAVLIVKRVLLLQALGDHLELRLGLRQRPTRLKPTHHIQIMVIVIG